MDFFWQRVQHGTEVDDCWLWTGTVDTPGYGRVQINRRKIGAHRVAYEALVGPIPEGLDLDHLCRNRLCVNPAHLEPVTRRENLLRGNTVPAQRAARTHCPAGHEYTPENTYYSARNQRNCKECNRLSCRRYYAKTHCHVETGALSVRLPPRKDV